MNDYKITYNEKNGLYDLEHDGQVVSSGKWDVVVYNFANMLIEDHVYPEKTMPEAMETVKEIISEQLSEEDLNGYMMQDLSDDLRDQTKLNKLILDFAYDVLDVMRTSKSAILGASKEVRSQIKLTAFTSIQELIDMYADKLQEGDLT